MTDPTEWITAELRLDDDYHPGLIARGEDLDESPRLLAAMPVKVSYLDGDVHQVELEVSRTDPVTGMVVEEFSIILEPDEARAVSAQILRAIYACNQESPDPDMITMTEPREVGEA